MKDSRLSLKYRSKQCLNCEHPLDISDKYCPNCGQLNTTKKLSVSDILKEFFASLISYDSRLRNTLNALLFKPGKISKEYIEGRRQRYVNPFRFYLSVSIIFFILYGFTLNTDEVNMEMKSLEEDNLNFNFTYDDDNHPDLDTITSYKDIYRPEEGFAEFGTIKNLEYRLELYQRFNKETTINIPTIGLDSLKHNNTLYHRYLYQKGTQLNDITKDLGSLYSFFISKMPFIIFFYLPIFALFLWLLFVRHRFSYMEHLIFLFHVQSLFFVVFSISLILTLTGLGDIVYKIASILFLCYLYLALRTFYRQKHFKTVLKFLILNVVFLVLAGVGGILAFLVSFAIY